jgi:hypothetical protein
MTFQCFPFKIKSIQHISCYNINMIIMESILKLDIFNVLLKQT